MTWQEAHPATSGRKCSACGETELGWFCDINEPGGDLLAKKMVEVLSQAPDPQKAMKDAVKKVAEYIRTVDEVALRK